MSFLAAVTVRRIVVALLFQVTLFTTPMVVASGYSSVTAVLDDFLLSSLSLLPSLPSSLSSSLSSSLPSFEFNTTTTTTTSMTNNTTNTNHGDTASIGIQDNVTDLTWEEHFYKLDQGDKLATMGLLKLYECPLYSDQFGIEVEVKQDQQQQKHQQQGTAHAQPPPPPPAAYSRIPTESETWTLFEDAYYYAVGMEAPPKKKQKEDLGHRRGMQIPYEVRYDNHNSKVGRGVYTTTLIPKGTTVWLGTHTAAFTATTAADNDTDTDTDDDTGVFQSASYRRFIEYLHNDHMYRQQLNVNINVDNVNNDTATTQHTTHDTTQHDWACDALMWTYGGNQYNDTDTDDDDDDDTDDKAALCIAFDDGSMFNDAKGNSTAANLENGQQEQQQQKVFGLEGDQRQQQQHDDGRKTKTKMKLPGSDCQYDGHVVAMRDIQPGEGKNFIFLI